MNKFVNNSNYHNLILESLVKKMGWSFFVSCVACLLAKNLLFLFLWRKPCFKHDLSILTLLTHQEAIFPLYRKHLIDFVGFDMNGTLTAGNSIWQKTSCFQQHSISAWSRRPMASSLLIHTFFRLWIFVSGEHMIYPSLNCHSILVTKFVESRHSLSVRNTCFIVCCSSPLVLIVYNLERCTLPCNWVGPSGLV